MRFLHLADIHLDTAFRGRSQSVREALRQASHTALERAVSEAIERRADALLVAGDLFDSERVSVQTERFLLKVLDRLREPGIQVVYATGNHDPATPASPATRIPWPGHVRVLAGSEPERVEIHRGEEVVGVVTGAGHESLRVSEDLTRRFPRPEGAGPEVAVLHTQVFGARGSEDHQPYAPSELPTLRTSGYDYWALGHVHGRQVLSEDPPIHYPGNPQGRNPRETGAKGGLFVDLGARDRPRAEFLELGPIRWETLGVEGLDEEVHLSGLARLVERAWRTARARDSSSTRPDWILRVDLVGPSPLYRKLAEPGAMDELQDAVQSELGLLEVEVRGHRLRPLHRVEDHVERGDVLGQVLKLAMQLKDTDGPSPSEVLGVDRSMLAHAPEAEGRALDDYLRELLQDADPSLLDRLLTDEAS